MGKTVKLFIFFTVLFMPMAVSAATPDYTITVNFADFTLSLWQAGDQLVARYPVALPKFMPKNFPIIGEVARIERNPVWYPTANTRRYLSEKKKTELPVRIEPGDSRNAMGAVKIIVVFFTAGVDSACRIHGTNDPVSIGQRISRWCIRLHNSDILALSEMINGKKTKVFFVRS